MAIIDYSATVTIDNMTCRLGLSDFKDGGAKLLTRLPESAAKTAAAAAELLIQSRAAGAEVPLEDQSVAFTMSLKSATGLLKAMRILSLEFENNSLLSDDPDDAESDANMVEAVGEMRDILMDIFDRVGS